MSLCRADIRQSIINQSQSFLDEGKTPEEVNSLFKDTIVTQTNIDKVKPLERELMNGFLKDFGITTKSYNNIKEDLGVDALTMSDLVTKSIAYQEGESILPETAYFAFSMLGKQNNKLRSELRYLVSKWGKYKERFRHHSKLIEKKEGFIADSKLWKNKIRDQVIIDFLSEHLNNYYDNPEAFEKVMDSKWTKEDFTLWQKIVNAIKEFLQKFSSDKSKVEKLEAIGRSMASEVLDRNYQYFNYNLKEDQIQKYYKQTIESDPFAKELVEFGQKEMGIVLTGSLALRKAGSVYRTAEESLHDIDWVVPYELNSDAQNKATLDKMMIGNIGVSTDQAIKIAEGFDWMKKFRKKYPNFQLTKAFYGNEHNSFESITIQGVIDGKFYEEDGYHKEEVSYYKKDYEDKHPVKVKKEVKKKHKKGDLIEGTGYAIDFFVRMQPNQEQHENYFKLWKEIMIAKLKMGREKDFSDWKAFAPYMASNDRFNFNYEGFRHINWSEDNQHDAFEDLQNGLKTSIEPSEELVDHYWQVYGTPEQSNEEDTIPQEPSFLDHIEQFEQDSNTIQSRNPEMFEPQAVSNTGLLNKYVDTINEEHDNIIAQVTQDEEDPTQVKVLLSSTEALPENLQANLKEKKYNSFETAKHTLGKVAERLMKVFPEMRIEWVHPFDLNQQDHSLPVQDINSFVKGNTVYLVEGRFNAESAIDELLHPFTYGMSLKNRALFDNIFNQHKDQYSDVYAHYQKIGEEEAQIEVVNRAIQDGLKEQASLWEQVKDFLKRVMQKLFPASAQSIQTKDISPKTSVKELSRMLLHGGYKFEHYYTQQPFYNATNNNLNKQLADFQALMNRAAAMGVNKQEKQSEFDAGYLWKGAGTARISDIISANTEKKFRNAPQSELDQLEADLAKEDGTDGHAIAQDVIERYTDKATGLKRVTPIATRNLNGQSEEIYNEIEKYLVGEDGKGGLLGSYSDQCRFLTETVLFDEKKGAMVKQPDGSRKYVKGLAGTVDLIVITEDNKKHVYDWKFMSEAKIGESARSWKRENWETQLSNYVDMIKLATGAKSEDFELVRIKPFIRNYSWNIDGQKEWTGVMTSHVDVNNTPIRKMIPYVSAAEHIKNANVATFISKIRSLIQSKVEQDILEGEKKVDYDFQNEIADAVNDFMAMGNIDQLYNIHVKVADEAEKALKELNAIEDADISSRADINRQLTNIFEMIEAVSNFRAATSYIYGHNLENLEDKDYANRIRTLNERIQVLSDTHKDVQGHLSDVMARDKAGIIGLNTTEKKVSTFLKNFTFLSSPETRTAAYFSTVLNKVMPKLRHIIKGFTNEMDNLLHGVSKELKGKGKDLKHGYSQLLQYDADNKFTGRFKNRIKSKFWEDRATLLKSGTIEQLQQFFGAFYDLPGIKQRWDKILNDKLDDIAKAEYAGSPATQERYREQDRQKVIARWDLTMSKEAYSFIDGRIQETVTDADGNETVNKAFSDQYHEDWYKDLLKDNNKELKKLYDFFMKVNRDLAQQEAISWKEHYTFVPNVEKGYIENGSKLQNYWNTLKGKIQVNENAGLYGAINHATGEPEYRINFPHVQDYFDGNYERKSEDLLRSYHLLIQGLEKAKVMKELEPLAKTLLRVESNKGVYNTDKNNRILKDPNNKDRKAAAILDQTNYNYLKQFIDTHVYSKVIQDGWDKQFSTTDSKTGEKRTYSLMSILQLGINSMYLKSFGLNVMTPLRMTISGLIGNKLLDNRYFDPSEDIKTSELFIKNISGDNARNKFSAAIGLFMPYLNPQLHKAADKLSMNNLTNWTSPEHLTFLMESSDMRTQMLISNAVLRNSVIIDGKLENAREWMRKQPGFNDMYTRLKGDINALKQQEKLFKQNVKDLIKNKGVINNSEVKDGKLVINGLLPEHMEEAIAIFSNTVQFYAQRITGMRAEANTSNYSGSVFWRMLMAYRTWIPHTVASRYGAFKYNTAIQDYQWGRHVALWDATAKSFQDSFGKGIKSIFGLNAKEDLINYAMQKYAKLHETMSYENRIMTENFMDENEFIRFYLNNIKSTQAEFRVMAAMLFLLSLGFMGAGGDDDDTIKNLKKFTSYQLYRLSDDFFFYYDPSSVGNILKSPVPAVDYLNSLKSALLAIPKEAYYDVTGQDKKAKSNNAIKTALQPIPVFSEILRMLPLIDNDLAKELGIKQQSTNIVK